MYCGGVRSLSALLVGGWLLFGQPTVGEIIREAGTLFKIYQDHGQTDADKATLVKFFTAHDADFDTNSEYLLSKARYLALVGNDVDARATFDRVPDRALTVPSDLFNRLQIRMAADPASAIPLALKLASASEAKFVTWVHDSLAQRYTPTARGGVQTPAHEALLTALAASEPSATVSAALRMWIEAGRTSDAVRLRQLARLTFDAPTAYAVRYQLLLAGLLELRPDVAMEAIDLRQRIIDELQNELRQLTRDDPRYTRDRYWLAYAFAAKARTAAKRDGESSQLEALRQASLYSPDAEDRLRAAEYFYEKATLGGQAEYRSSYADALEAAGDLPDALTVRTDAARFDAEMVPALRSLFNRARPGGSFDSYWRDARFTGRPAAPEFTLPTPSGEFVKLVSYRGRWILLDFWGTWCQPCQADMPLVDALAREYPNQVLALAFHDTPTTVANYMRQRGYSFPVVVGSDDIGERFHVPYFPFKVIVAPDGRYVALSNDTWEADVREWLAVR